MRGLFIVGTLVGVLVGLAFGLVLAWVVWPISYTEADPADLSLDYKDDYLRMIAATYSLDGDLARALQRLGTLQLNQPGASAANLVRRESHPLYQQALIHLALDLNQPSVALARPTYTPRPTRVWLSRRRTPTVTARVTPTSSQNASAEPTRTPIAMPSATPESAFTPTPEPTLPPPTSVPDPNAPQFKLKSKTAMSCLDAGEGSRIEVEVQDASGKPLPGIAVQVSSSAGALVFYTGLKPERGVGYADVGLSAGTFDLRLTENARSEAVELRIDRPPVECTTESPELRGWKLTFQQTSP